MGRKRKKAEGKSGTSGNKAGRKVGIGVAAAAALGGGVLAGARWAYNTAFRPNGDRASEPHAMPGGRQYEAYKYQIRKNVEKVMAVQFEPVEIRSDDGLRLFGRLYAGEGEFCGQQRPLAIFLHGYRSPAQRDGCGGFEMMRDMGFDLLMVDQRGHGRSGGETITLGIKEQYDCLNWIRYCTERFGPEKPVVLIGVSMGASTALLAASHTLPACVKGVIADCGYSSVKRILKQEIGKIGLPMGVGWQLVKLGAKVFGRFNPENGEVAEALKHCEVPVLLIHGQEDRFVPCEMSMENFEAIPGKKGLLTIPGAGHGMSWYLNQEGYRRAVREFCERIL